MRMKYGLILVVVSLVLTSCSSDMALELLDSKDGTQKNEYRISEQEAIAEGRRLLSMMDSYGDVNTRSSGYRRDVAEVENVISRSVTRSAQNDTVAYIINYGENDGFVVIAPDRRAYPLYAISDNGHLSLGDTIQNPGLSLFFNNMERDISARITVFPDTTKAEPFHPNDSIALAKKIIVRVKPMLPRKVADWNQHYPFNRYCFTEGGSQALVGCVALSTAQLMSFFKYPEEYNGHKYDWDDIVTNHGSNSLALLLSDLGRHENLDMTYGTGESKTDTGNVRRTLINLGFNDPGELRDFNSSGVNSALKSNPVVLKGWDDVFSIRHAWIIDGYSEYYDLEVALPEPIYLYHCLWGWRDASNGYFYFRDSHINLWDYESLDGDGVIMEDEVEFYLDLKYYGKVTY